MTLRDIMTEEVVYLLPEHNAHDAARKMKQLNVGIIPICDNDKRLLGVVTDRDIVLRVVAEGRDPETTELQQCATMDPIAGQPEWDLQAAVAMMSEYQIRRLPIVEGGRLIGIVSLGDLAVEQPSEALSGAALEEISKPAAPRRGAVEQSDHTA